MSLKTFSPNNCSMDAPEHHELATHTGGAYVKEGDPMTLPKDTTPPTGPRLPTPAEPPTWVELVNQERRLLDGLVEFWRARSRRPPAECEEIVARALEEALAEIIAEEPDEEKADELRRRAAARALARMYREGPRLVITRPMPITNSKTVVARNRQQTPQAAGG
jgi:hypothetical protein